MKQRKFQEAMICFFMLTDIINEGSEILYVDHEEFLSSAFECQ